MPFNNPFTVKGILAAFVACNPFATGPSSIVADYNPFIAALIVNSFVITNIQAITKAIDQKTEEVVLAYFILLLKIELK